MPLLGQYEGLASGPRHSRGLALLGPSPGPVLPLCRTEGRHVQGHTSSTGQDRESIDFRLTELYYRRTFRRTQRGRPRFEKQGLLQNRELEKGRYTIIFLGVAEVGGAEAYEC